MKKKRNISLLLALTLALALPLTACGGKPGRASATQPDSPVVSQNQELTPDLVEFVPEGLWYLSPCLPVEFDRAAGTAVFSGEREGETYGYSYDSESRELVLEDGEDCFIGTVDVDQAGQIWFTGTAAEALCDGQTESLRLFGETDSFDGSGTWYIAMPEPELFSGAEQYDLLLEFDSSILTPYYISTMGDSWVPLQSVKVQWDQSQRKMLFPEGDYWLEWSIAPLCSAFTVEMSGGDAGEGLLIKAPDTLLTSQSDPFMNWLAGPSKEEVKSWVWREFEVDQEPAAELYTDDYSVTVDAEGGTAVAHYTASFPSGEETDFYVPYTYVDGMWMADIDLLERTPDPETAAAHNWNENCGLWQMDIQEDRALGIWVKDMRIGQAEIGLGEIELGIDATQLGLGAIRAGGSLPLIEDDTDTIKDDCGYSIGGSIQSISDNSGTTMHIILLPDYIMFGTLNAEETQASIFYLTQRGTEAELDDFDF